MGIHRLKFNDWVSTLLIRSLARKLLILLYLPINHLLSLFDRVRRSLVFFLDFEGEHAEINLVVTSFTAEYQILVIELWICWVAA